MPLASVLSVPKASLVLVCCSSIAAVAAEEAANPLAVEAGDVLALDLLGAFGLAGVGVGAGAEAQLVHLADHLLHAVHGLGKLLALPTVKTCGRVKLNDNGLF